MNVNKCGNARQAVSFSIPVTVTADLSDPQSIITRSCAKFGDPRFKLSLTYRAVK